MRRLVLYLILMLTGMMSFTEAVAQTGEAMAQVAKKAAQMENGAAVAGDMIVRISEIEVYPEYLDQYLVFAKDVAETSVEKEPGVIAIFPMMEKRDSCKIRIVEIYASQDAYKRHIQSVHFQKYKQGTLQMVKSLDLVDMDVLSERNLERIFKKYSF